jgi:hypothetical protein
MKNKVEELIIWIIGNSSNYWANIVKSLNTDKQKKKIPFRDV